MTTEEIANNTQTIAGLGIKKGLNTVEQLILLGGGKLQPFRPTRDQAIMNMLEGRDVFEEPPDDMPKTLYGYASYLNNKANPDKEENISIGIPQLNNDNTKQQPNIIKENWDRNGNIYYTNETGDNVLPENKLSPTERLNRVIESRMANLKRRIEETNFNSPFYKNKVSAISSVLGGTVGIGGSATANIAEKLLPFTGRKIGQMTSQGISSGLGAGAAEGFVEGLYENQNPFITSVQHALTGGAIGGALGYAGGGIINFNRARALQELNQKRKVWGIAYRNYSGKPTEAIEKLKSEQKGFVPKASKRNGGIDFVWGEYIPPAKPNQKGGGYGLAHIKGRRNEQGINGEEFLNNLAQLIENGKKYIKKDYPGRFYIGNENNEAAIRTDYNKHLWKWLNSAYPKDK